jgi:hypothetical protein
VHQNYDRDLSAAFRQHQSPSQLRTVGHEGHVAHIEVDPLARLFSQQDLAHAAVGERDDLAIRAIRPPICGGPCMICLRMKLAPLTTEHQPAQCVAIRRRNIYCPAVAQAIRADMAVLDCIGRSRDNRERKQKRKDHRWDRHFSSTCSPENLTTNVLIYRLTRHRSLLVWPVQMASLGSMNPHLDAAT